ncbi:hypothetical protein BCR44DRAFT_376455 [Catenaria anguillulae PL171]|uniref:Uncharacterized protein n=1 Tax=Catenaria anguillulae PL171 TaxID=765915 RepID=A0A1Y2I1W9_9FUNG|nr:hypothetical protein BCR44DRAFT_376455 [Catenaria anguillulae PL171]
MEDILYSSPVAHSGGFVWFASSTTQGHLAAFMVAVRQLATTHIPYPCQQTQLQMKSVHHGIGSTSMRSSRLSTSTKSDGVTMSWPDEIANPDVDVGLARVEGATLDVSPAIDVRTDVAGDVTTPDPPVRSTSEVNVEESNALDAIAWYSWYAALQ